MMLARSSQHQIAHLKPSTLLAAILSNGQKRAFATNVGQYPERYFMVEYEYIQDAYYKRIPVRDEHLEALEKLKTTA